MTATAADIGQGIVFSMKATANATTYTDIAEVYDISPPNEQVDQIDATHYGSTGGYREFILGLTDPGDCTIDMNLVPGSASETLLLTAKANRVALPAKIHFPRPAPGYDWTFLVLVKGYEPALPLDGKMTAKVTFKVSGTVTRAATSA